MRKQTAVRNATQICCFCIDLNLDHRNSDSGIALNNFCDLIFDYANTWLKSASEKLLNLFPPPGAG